MTAKKVLISLFFLSQIVLIFSQLKGDTNFFNWSMYHTCIVYDANVTVNGEILDDDAFYERYRIKKNGIEGKALGHLKRVFIKREELYNDEHVEIELLFTENTHKNVWNWKN